MLILQLNHAILVIEQCLQLTDARAQFFILTRLGFNLLPGQGDFLFQLGQFAGISNGHTLFSRGAFRTTLLGHDDFQFGFLFFGFLLRNLCVLLRNFFPGRFFFRGFFWCGGWSFFLRLLHRCLLWHGCTSELLAIFLPQRMLFFDFSTGLLPADAVKRGAVRYPQDVAMLEPVDVSAHECLRVLAQQPDHHLFDANIGRTIIVSNFPERIPALNLVLSCRFVGLDHGRGRYIGNRRTFRHRRRFGFRQCFHSPGRNIFGNREGLSQRDIRHPVFRRGYGRCRWLSRRRYGFDSLGGLSRFGNALHNFRLGRDGCRRSDRRCLLLTKDWRVEQNSVFPQQTPFGPCNFNHEIEKWFSDGSV